MHCTCTYTPCTTIYPLHEYPPPGPCICNRIKPAPSSTTSIQHRLRPISFHTDDTVFIKRQILAAEQEQEEVEEEKEKEVQREGKEMQEVEVQREEEMQEVQREEEEEVLGKQEVPTATTYCCHYLLTATATTITTSCH
jgi:DNA-directed RNA polymerase beta' subunit